MLQIFMKYPKSGKCGACFIAKLDVQGSMDAPVTFSAELGIYGIASKTTATS